MSASDRADSVLPVRSKGLWSEALSKLAIPGQPEQGYGTADAALTRKLDPRRMHDSYCEIVLPFASSPEMLEDYTNASGGIRTGLLMEHLDSLAGSIAYKHVLGPDIAALPMDAGFYIVTASIERCVIFGQWYCGWNTGMTRIGQAGHARIPISRSGYATQRAGHPHWKELDGSCGADASLRQEWRGRDDHVG